MWNSHRADKTIVFVADKENAYLEEQKDGSYLLYMYGISMEVSASDVEEGLYDYYPIIEYEEDRNVIFDFFMEMKEHIDNFFHKGGK